MAAVREINIKPTFMNELHGLPVTLVAQLWEKVNWLVDNPLPDGKLKKKLKTKKDLYRLRVGDYRVFYTFGDTWVRLLGVRRRDDRTFSDKLESLKADAPLTVGAPDDTPLEDLLETVEAGRPTFQFSKAVLGPTETSLPRPITIDWLQQLKVPLTAFPSLVACHSEEALLRANVPPEVLERVVDNLFPPPIEIVAEQPDLVVRDAEDLVRYRNGDLVAFLLRLDEDQMRLTDWALSGPTMVKGGAGTGKSTVALYRVKRLLERAGATGKERVLFTTYTRALVTASRQLLKQLLTEEQFGRVRVATCDELAREIVASVRELGPIEGGGVTLSILRTARAGFEPPGPTGFDRSLRARVLATLPDRYLLEEFEWIIGGRELNSLEDYRQAPRPGRGIALRDGARTAVWFLHEAFVAEVATRKIERFSALRAEARQVVRSGQWKGSFDYVVVDEAQDLTPAALCLMAEVAKTEEGLFFASDDRQSLYSRNYSWNAVHPRLKFHGRTAVLKRNYRSTEEIEKAAADVLSTTGEAPPLQSVHNGPIPILLRGMAPEAEGEWIARFLKQMSRHLRLGLSSAAVLVPTNECGASIAADLVGAGIPARFFQGRDLDLRAEAVKVMTLHSAKGLEFPLVVLAGFGPQTYLTRPAEGDVGAYEEWLGNQRRLLYVGMSRAMRALMVCVNSECEHEAVASLKPENWAVEVVA